MPTLFTVPPPTNASKSVRNRSRLLRTASKPCFWPCAASAEHDGQVPTFEAAYHAAREALS